MVTDAGDDRFVEAARWQFAMAWRLLDRYYLDGLTDVECHLLPAPGAAAVRRDDDGVWHADWDDVDEDGTPPPATAGWLSWHIIWWLGNAIAEFEGRPLLPPNDVEWPGSAVNTVARLRALADRWAALLDGPIDDLGRPTTFPWPDPAPLHRLIAWVNMELMKNAAELGDAVRLARNR